jgi:hypothetical protein
LQSEHGKSWVKFAFLLFLKVLKQKLQIGEKEMEQKGILQKYSQVWNQYIQSNIIQLLKEANPRCPLSNSAPKSLDEVGT